MISFDWLADSSGLGSPELEPTSLHPSDGPNPCASGLTAVSWTAVVPFAHEPSACSWTVSVFVSEDVLVERDNAGTATKYVYANGLRIAKVLPSGAVHYYLADHEGSTRQVRDANRNLVFSTEYEPFGKPYAVTGSEAYKYTSERHDDPTGLVYLRARQYDPELGRFTSADPVLGSLSAPQTQNRFTYVANNPLTFTDPSGQTACNPEARDDLYRACQGWEAHRGFMGSVSEYMLAHPRQMGVWETVDFLMMMVSFFPIVGLVADAYFLGKALYAGVTTGEWDLLSIGLNALGLGGVAFGMVRIWRAADRLADVTRAVGRVDELGGLPETASHMRRAGSVPGGISELSSLAKDFLKGAIHSPGGFRFLSKAGKGGLRTFAVAGEGKLAIVHLGASRWVGTFVDGVGDIGKEVGRLQGKGFKPAYVTDLVRALLG